MENKNNDALREGLEQYIRNTEDRLSKFKELKLRLETATDEEDLISIYKNLRKQLTGLEATIINSRMLYLNIPDVYSNKEIEQKTTHMYDAIADEIDFKLEYLDDDIWHILMPMLPNNQGVRKSKWVGSTIPYLIEKGYKNIVDRLEEEPEISAEKTIILLHHYDDSKSNRTEIDIDNYQIKTLIDALNPYIISSDSTRNLSIYQTGIADNSYFTEVFIGPNNRSVLEIISKKYHR